MAWTKYNIYHKSKRWSKGNVANTNSEDRWIHTYLSKKVQLDNILIVISTLNIYKEVKFALIANQVSMLFLEKIRIPN